jgi:hypothetical protein
MFRSFVAQVMAHMHGNRGLSEETVKTEMALVLITAEYALRRRPGHNSIQMMDGEQFAISEYKFPKVFSEMSAMSRVFAGPNLVNSYTAKPVFDFQDGITADALISEWVKILDGELDTSKLGLTYPARIDKFYGDLKAKKVEIQTSSITNTLGIGMNELPCFLNAAGDKLLATNASSGGDKEMLAQILEIKIGLPEEYFDQGRLYSEERIETFLKSSLING